MSKIAASLPKGQTRQEYYEAMQRRKAATAPAATPATTPAAAKETVTQEKSDMTSANHTTNSKHEVSVSAPVFHMHVPAPTVNIEAGKFPGVWAVARHLHIGVLNMVLGASLYAVFGRKLLVLAGL